MEQVSVLAHSPIQGSSHTPTCPCQLKADAVAGTSDLEKCLYYLPHLRIVLFITIVEGVLSGSMMPLNFCTLFSQAFPHPTSRLRQGLSEQAESSGTSPSSHPRSAHSRRTVRKSPESRLTHEDPPPPLDLLTGNILGLSTELTHTKPPRPLTGTPTKFPPS